jgi:hypothetical protein
MKISLLACILLLATTASFSAETLMSKEKCLQIYQKTCSGKSIPMCFKDDKSKFKEIPSECYKIIADKEVALTQVEQEANSKKVQLETQENISKCLNERNKICGDEETNACLLSKKNKFSKKCYKDLLSFQSVEGIDKLGVSKTKCFQNMMAGCSIESSQADLTKCMRKNMEKETIKTNCQKELKELAKKQKKLINF